jgi:PAS domain S-box-containing protein
MDQDSKFEQRVLVLPLTAKDAELTRSILNRAGVECVACTSVQQICTELDAGAGAMLIAEEAMVESRDDCLADFLAGQPPWSDLPILVSARPGADSAAVAQAMDLLGNVTVLERPIRVAALVSAVRTALRARSRQYETRNHLAELTRAFEARSRLAAIVDSSDDAIISKSLDGRIQTWNAGAERLFGYQATEVVGRPITILIPADRQHEEPVLLARLRRGERIDHFETVRVTKDGRHLNISLSVSPIQNAQGQIVGAAKVARDITEQKRAEAALRSSEQHLELLSNTVPALISYVGPDRCYRSCNAAYTTWFDLPHEQIVGRPMREVVGEAAWTIIGPHVESAFAGRAVEYEAEAHYQRGGTRWIHASYKPHLDIDGQVLGVIILVTDITARKQIEQALLDTDRRKDEFLAMLAHELRNPLAPIRNSLNILRMMSQSDPTVEQVGQMMERQVNHMVRLVDDLLEVSRITRGKIELRLELMEVAGVVRTAIETSQPLITAAGHQLAVSIPAEPLTVNADPVRLAQIISNLLNNSAKYTEAGGQIWLAVRREDDRVAISVRDSGIGITPEMLPHVFQLFTQVDRNANRAQGGLGIGLALVKSLTELHGGEVHAHSAGLGRGSEFVIRLPLASEQAGSDPPRVEDRPRSESAARRILVVDDNRDAAMSMSMLLKLLGSDVRVAFDGEDALRAMFEYKPAIVLLDIGMPGMDGYQVARRIREQSEFDDVTLIALTGWGQEDDRRRSRSAGFDHHLTKPADIDALETLLLSLQ